MAISEKIVADVRAIEASRPRSVAQPLASPIAGQHIGALDGVRGAAILLVLFYHYGNSARVFGIDHPIVAVSAIGWCGVDMFFVLSGFLITGILYDSRHSEGYFRNFYARRTLRIFPLYYLALLVVAALSLAWPSAGLLGTHSVLWPAFYLTNVAIAAGGPDATGVVSHFWSLAVEEHFYLVWPLLVLWCSRHRLMLVAAGLIAAALALRVGTVALDGPTSAVYMLTPLRIDALAVGALCALLVRGAYAQRRGLLMPAWVAMLGGAAMLIAIVLVRRRLDPYDPVMQTVGFTLLAVTFAGALMLALYWRPLSLAFNNRVLRWFGRYSYGIYIWHPIVNVLLFTTSVGAAFAGHGAAGLALLFVIAFGLSLLISLASYHGVEKHFLGLKHRFQ